jgi:hypothetical protein
MRGAECEVDSRFNEDNDVFDPPLSLVGSVAALCCLLHGGEDEVDAIGAEDFVGEVA